MQLSSTDSRVQQMFKLLLDKSAPASDRQKVLTSYLLFVTHTSLIYRYSLVFHGKIISILQAAQNLVVISREDAGAEQIFRNDGVKLLHKLLESQQEDIVLSALRTLVGLCTGHQSRVRCLEKHASAGYFIIH